MWQVYALFARDMIEERNREAREIRIARRAAEEDQQIGHQRRVLLRHRFAHRA